jgi:hypothetical protein
MTPGHKLNEDKDLVRLLGTQVHKTDQHSGESSD